jgi:NAD(P) transhydrogenase subunit alpha
MTGIVWYLTIFVLAGFVGYEVISKVPSILHTPLMSGSNAIHGIVLVGALFIMGEATGPAQLVLGFITVFLATLNIVGGFVVTDRMLEMFHAKPERAAAPAPTPAAPSAGPPSAPSAEATGAPEKGRAPAEEKPAPQAPGAESGGT